MRPIAYERGDDWQVSYFTGTGSEPHRGGRGDRRRPNGALLGAWHDHQLDDPLARGYSGAIAQKVNAPYVWLPLCLLFLLPFFDPRRPFRLLHLDLLVLLGLGALAPLLQPRRDHHLGAAHLSRARLRARRGCCGSGFGRGTGQGPLVPLVPVRWLAVAAIVARLRPDRAQRRRLARDRHRRRRGGRRRPHRPRAGPLRRRLRARAWGSAATSTGRSTTSPTCRSRRSSRGTATGATFPAAHAAAIAFDLLTALGLLALGRRLRPGAGRAGPWGSRSPSRGSPIRSRSTR